MTSALDLDDLRPRLTGPALARGEDGFDEQLRGFNLAAQLSPDAVVGAAHEADVVEAVRFAARHHLPVRVLATGHGPAEPVTDGIIIATRALDSLHIDPDSRLATIGAGLKWEAVQAAAAPLGLTAITGSSPDVGAVGLVLGGGLGPLARSHGASSDYVRSFRVVTREGEAVTASAEEHPELFWALRGGKGGLGVVTEMTVELLPLTMLYAGALLFDTPHVEAALRGWIAWTATAPAEVTTSAAMIQFPDIDDVPPPLRGRHGLALRFAYPGDPAEGERLAAPLRALAPAAIDVIGPLPTALMGLIHNDPSSPLPAWDFGFLLTAADNELVDVVLEHVGPGSGSPLMVAEVRHLGGKTATDVVGGSAVGGRSGAYSFFAVGVPDPSLFEVVLPAAAERISTALAPWTATETAVNFCGRFRSPEHFASAWSPETFARLATVKSMYDPLGLFTYGPKAG